MAEDSLPWCHWYGPAHTGVCVCVGVGRGVLWPLAGRGLQGRPHTRGLLDVYSVELRATLPAPQKQG